MSSKTAFYVMFGVDRRAQASRDDARRAGHTLIGPRDGAHSTDCARIREKSAEADMQVIVNLDEEQARLLIRQSLVEMIEARDQALYELIAEVLEDLALGRAVQEGRESELISREEVMRVLAGPT